MNTPAASPRLLVVDDEPDLRTLYELTLLREGYVVDSAGTLSEAEALLQEHVFQLVITDIRLPDGSGLELLQRLESGGRPERTIVITAYGSAENAVEALKSGAFDYLTKPVDLRQFRSVVASALGRAPAIVAVPPPAPARGRGLPDPARTAPLARTPQPADALRRLVGGSLAMQQLRTLIERVARGMAPVMVNGESGTGKELVARAIHGVSPRHAQPFVAVNCGAIPEQLLEAEFFGYRKGAFTGAQEDRQGFFQAAQGGTLFLDEIGDLPLLMQSKLLRAIQERSVRPLGSVSETAVNVRIVSATHKDLAQEVQAGRFRQDLFYRLNVIQLRLPPLRERMDDLPALCEAVLVGIARDAGVSPPPRLSADALSALAGHAFPGNVRELENLLHRAVAMARHDVLEAVDLGLDGLDAGADDGVDVIDDGTVWSPPSGPAAGDVTAAAGQGAVAEGDEAAVALPVDLVAHLDAVERAILVRALELHRNNRTAAGVSLGLSLRQIRYRMARLGIAVGDAGGEAAGGGA
ncbi:MAG: hypothetical protein RL223_2899 [Pseudomonadota bacterium]